MDGRGFDPAGGGSVTIGSAATAMSSEIMVSATGLTRHFGGFVAVDGVSFDVAPGEIFGFLGSNGAGKTTVIRMLCGLLKPTSGSGTVAGFDIATRAAEIKTRIGYMSQKFSLYADLTVDENLRFWAGTYQVWGRQFEEGREWAIEMTGLGSRRSSLVADLPGGFRQRLALSCALLHRPRVVFLDEPTGGVDPEARRRFWDLIDDLSAEGVTVFVTTHYMDEAERCHRVALMHAGRLLALDTIAELKQVFPPGTVIEVECGDAPRALERLEILPGVIDAALFGEHLHAVVEDPEVATTIQSFLAGKGFTSVSVRHVVPSLEDVFIRSIRDAEEELKK
jgi:ABC-2 type transport system ATP-binding protein